MAVSVVNRQKAGLIIPPDTVNVLFIGNVVRGGVSLEVFFAAFIRLLLMDLVDSALMFCRGPTLVAHSVVFAAGGADQAVPYNAVRAPLRVPDVCAPVDLICRALTDMADAEGNQAWLGLRPVAAARSLEALTGHMPVQRRRES